MAKGDRLWPPLARGNHDRSIQTDYWPATSGEAAIGVAVLNRMLGAGRPDSVRSSKKTA